MYDRTIIETVDYHHTMLEDKVRMQSYLRAILKAVEPGDVVLDIGSGTGIIAYFACMTGALSGMLRRLRFVFQINGSRLLLSRKAQRGQPLPN